MIVPMLAYENGVTAMDWLIRAFGFVERVRMVNDQGRLSHGELEWRGQVVMVAEPSALYQSPDTLALGYEPARAWQEVPYIFDGVVVMVKDLDSHYLRAKTAGAKILSDIEYGFPGKRYRAADCEGHRWFFIQKVEA